MGVGQLLAEVERLRAEIAERDRELAEERAARAESERRLEEERAANATRERDLAEERQKVEALTNANEELARKLWLLRLKHSGRKNERYDDSTQLSLVGVPAMPTPPPRAPKPDDGAKPPASEEKPRRAKPRRRNLAERDDMPTREVVAKADPDAACVRCGGHLEVLGQAVSYRVEWVPGYFQRHKVLRDKCACPRCPSEGVLTTPDPYVLPRAMCGNTFLARVLVDKFADHIPLNRQAKRISREGFEITKNVLSDWVLSASGDQVLGRIADAIEARLLASRWLQADDTGFPVQDGVGGELRKGRLWAFSDQEEVRYRFTDSKSGEEISEILAGSKAEALLVDMGSEFNQVVRELGTERAGCWSHLRRYFFDARHHHPIEAHLALGTIRDIFVLERGLKGAPRPLVLEVRQRDVKPLVDGLFEWIDKVSLSVRPKSALGEAVNYATNNRVHFRVFLDRPELPVHNNLAELLLRSPVVGRKNWLFAGSEGGARGAANIYTVIGSCVLQGIDPLAYLADVFGRLLDHPATRLHELTPRGWRLACEAAARATSPDPA